MWEILRVSNFCFACCFVDFLYTTVNFVLTISKNVKSDYSSYSSGSIMYYCVINALSAQIIGAMFQLLNSLLLSTCVV